MASHTDTSDNRKYEGQKTRICLLYPKPWHKELFFEGIRTRSINPHILREERNTAGNGVGAGNYKVEKLQKVEKETWKAIKVPEPIWRAIKMEAAKKGIKIFQELGETYL